MNIMKILDRIPGNSSKSAFGKRIIESVNRLSKSVLCVMSLPTADFHTNMLTIPLSQPLIGCC